jgi:GNAT superfamily N-acetyltransferase
MNSFQPPATIVGQHQAKATRRSCNRPLPGSTFSDRVRVASLEYSDSEALLAMLARCSPTTLYRRFHGVTDGVPYARQVLSGSADQDSFAAWIGDRCVGLGNLRLLDGSTELGVLVEDAWQRRGIGSALLVALVRRARESRSPSLQADVLADNDFAPAVLARVGPTRISLAQGTYSVVVDLRLAPAAAHAAPDPSQTNQTRCDPSTAETLAAPVSRSCHEYHR